MDGKVLFAKLQEYRKELAKQGKKATSLHRASYETEQYDTPLTNLFLFYKDWSWEFFFVVVPDGATFTVYSSGVVVRGTRKVTAWPELEAILNRVLSD